MTGSGTPGIIRPVAESGRFDFFKTRQGGLLLLAVGLLAAAGLTGNYLLAVKPEFERTRLRAEAQMDLLRLEELQLAYRKRYALYAADLEALLRSAPDAGAALRSSLKAHTHLDTLVVAGDAEKYRLEANVRDPERTLLVIKGPRPAWPPPAPKR